MRGLAMVLLFAALFLCRPAAADPLPSIGLRSGEHPGFGRLVLDLPHGAAATAAAQDGTVIVRSTGAV
ncbi:MAG: hypothetical protein J0H91_22175, partial [Rhodospirillales bacterium]|nr:hypothetical protein [Rhodospirillales bacterium]